VLRWLVEGAVKWYASKTLKRDAPEKVRSFSRAYFEEQDNLSGFIREMCTRGEDEKVKTADLLMEYKDWCKDNDCGGQVTSKTLAAGMAQKGYEKKAVKHEGVPLQHYIGISLKPRDYQACSDA